MCHCGVNGKRAGRTGKVIGGWITVSIGVVVVCTVFSSVGFRNCRGACINVPPRNMKLTNRKHNTNNPTCKYANMGIAYAFWVMVLSVKVTILGDKNVLQKTATCIRKKGYFDPRTSTSASTESHKPRVRYIWYTTVDKATMLYIYFTCILWLGRWTKVVQSVTRTCYSNWQIQRKPFPRHTFLGANDAFYFTLCPPSLRYSIDTARIMHACTARQWRLEVTP